MEVTIKVSDGFTNAIYKFRLEEHDNVCDICEQDQQTNIWHFIGYCFRPEEAIVGIVNKLTKHGWDVVGIHANSGEVVWKPGHRVVPVPLKR